ncbi:MAG: ExbD/TolR family protein [Limisphaerales bacterium]
MKFGHAVEKKHARIEIIPLIDIMFFLLASFMMVTLKMSKLSTIKVDMPTARSIPSSQQDVNPDFFSITLKPSGDIFLGDTQVNLAELSLHMSNRFPRGNASTNLPIYVVGDRSTPHGAVIGVLNVVRGAGFQRVSFAVTAASKNP